MSDRAIVCWAVLVLLFASLACNAFAGRVDTLPPPPSGPTATPAMPEPQPQTSVPGLAPTVTLPPNAPIEAVQGSVRILVDLNIRSGPGVRFDRVGFLLRDARARVVGRDQESGWWKIECPPDTTGTDCWVSGGSQFTLFESAP